MKPNALKSNKQPCFSELINKIALISARASHSRVSMQACAALSSACHPRGSFLLWTEKAWEIEKGKNKSVTRPCDLGGFHQATKRQSKQISYHFWSTMVWLKVLDHVQLYSSLLFFISRIIASVAFASNTLQSPSATRFFKVVECSELLSVSLCVPETKLAGETAQVVDCFEKIWSEGIDFESSTKKIFFA